MRFLSRLLVVLLVLPLLAQAPATFEEKVVVSYVEVPVTVVGRDGAAVRGLTRDNFEVYEDDHKREIESFEAIDFASRDTVRTVSPLNPAARRNFLLLFDLSFSNPTSIGRAQQAARNFIARSVGIRDLVAVGVIDVNFGFRFLTSFTTDRQLLTSAIADPLTFRTFDPLQIAGTSPLPDTPRPLTLGGGGDRSSRAEEVFADAARVFRKDDDTYNRTRVNKQVEHLASIAQALQKLAGRKHLVLLSEGFDPRLVQGRSVNEVQEQKEENLALEFGEVWKVDSDKRYGHASSQRNIRLMAQEFQRADVVLHAVDIKGVRVQNTVQAGATISSNDALFLLASPTGGTVFRNSNDIDAGFERLTRQHEIVYVLGFRAPLGKPGQFHDLKVKVNGIQRVRVHHRAGYYDSGGENAQSRALSTAEVILNDIPQMDLDVAALAAPFPGSGEDGKAQVPVVLEIKGDDLIRHASRGFASTEVFLYAFDEEGLVRDSLFQPFRLELAVVEERLRGKGIRFYGTLRLPPGNYAVKSLVRIAETQKMGFRRLEVAVPAAGDVSLVPPLFFADPNGDEWVMVKASRDPVEQPYPFVLGGETFIPTPRATLRKGEPRLFTLFVYNADPAELTWEIVPEATLVSETAGEAVTKYLFALERVPAGTTELGVTMRRKDSTDTRRVTVPISVQ